MIGKVYKLETEYGFYIGSSFRDVEIRVTEHIHDAKYTKKCSSARILKDAVNIQYTILEYVNTNDKYVLKERERHHMIANPQCVNTYRPYDGNISHLAPYQKVTCPDCNIQICKKARARNKKRMHSTPETNNVNVL